MRSLIALFLALWLTPAWAQVPMTGAGLGKPAVAVTFSLNFTDWKTDTGGGTGPITYTVGGSSSGSNPNIGTANANRIVVVAIYSRLGATATVASVSIGGNAATQASSAASTIAGSSLTDIWYLAVPTGTTASVAVTYNGSTLASGIAIYSVVTATAAPTNGQATTGVGVSSLNRSPVIPTGGGVICVAGITTNSGPNFTWTTSGSGPITEDVDTDIGTRHYGSAHDTGDAGTTPTITVTYISSSNMNLSCASWGP